MGRGEDRISNLPDPILQSILCMMPLKSAIRTSTLSKRWRNLWEYSLISSAALEFGDEFSCNQSPKQFVSMLNRYLHIYESKHVEKFRILFSPFDLFFRDIETWIGFAVSKGVKQLDIDLSQGIVQNGVYIDGKVAFVLPNSLFECNTLTNLSLSRCDIASPFDVSGFRGLRQLSLSHVNITNDMLERMLVDCRALESLSIKSCLLLSEIRITGPELRLQKLTIMDCFEAYDLEISAPKLQSLIYYGRICSTNEFHNMSSLVDACIYSIGRVNYDLDDDYAKWISDLSQVKVLTLCSVALMVI